MKRLLLVGALVGALLAPAYAQVNTVPQVGVETAIVKQNTYSAVSLALVPAASATDVFCISGSSSKAISIKRIVVSGTAGTLVTVPVTILRRTSVDTGGTAALTTALPVASTHMTTQPAATATLIAYTANPTIVDSSPLYFGSRTVTFPVTSAGTSSVPGLWTFGEEVGTFTRGLDIPSGSTGQQVCVNLNAVSISSGLLNIEIVWIEA